MQTTNDRIIAHEGIPFIAIGIALTVFGFWIHWALGIVFTALTLFTVYFFRNPKRVIPQGQKCIVSPADGVVIKIDELLDEPRFLKEPTKRVCVFMSPFNVHVNRVPLSGTVKEVSYNKGKFFPAFEDKASLANEQNAVVIQNENGMRVLFIQIAGWLARRIVCYAKPQQQYGQGDIYGLIRFGSRADVYVPVNCKLEVKLGDKVKAGETILASYN